MKTIIPLPLILIGSLAMAQGIRHQQGFTNDPHFPTKGKINAALLSTYSSVTPPPVLIGYVMYGFSRKFSAGVVGGTTGALALYGGKLNAVLHQQNDFRIFLRFMSVYYPARDGSFLFDKKTPM